MAELRPAPFGNLARRIFKEFEREQKIFDLPASSFFRGSGDLDTSVVFHGRHAATPLGPAAGPHNQLAQNIVLCWLGGSRILELKTVQIQDRLQIPRPCIDATNVGFNVEWSQELSLEESLREYVGASMLLELICESGLLGDSLPAAKQGTILDMSVGYDLQGIRSEPVRRWIQAMKDATPIIDGLRDQLPGELRRFRGFDFNTRISDSLTLSTFHGCPAEEIERMAHFLLTEMDLQVTIKMNPTLLGREQVEHLLHEVLGYTEIRITQEAFDKDLQFEEALEICRRLDSTARRLGKRLGVKFSNTLVVQNHKAVFKDAVMYLSGAPLHVLTMNLLGKFRERAGSEFPISFSAGIDQHNFPAAAGLNLVPVTTCTDLLRPGGYARLPKYLKQLESRMRSLGVRSMGDYVLMSEGRAEEAIRFGMQPVFRAAEELGAALLPETFLSLWSFLEQSTAGLTAALGQPEKDIRCGCAKISEAFDSEHTPRLSPKAADHLRQRLQGLHTRMVERAGLLNTPAVVARATADSRYAASRNRAVPRKIGSRLWLFDCINCDKCVPVCPNDANFVYELEPLELEVPVLEVGSAGFRQVATEPYTVQKAHQLANLADFCNDCGNCDVFCPEDGGPYLEKPRFFRTAEDWRKQGHLGGFCLQTSAASDLLRGRINGKEFSLEVDLQRDLWTFKGSGVKCMFIGDQVNPTEVQLLDSETSGNRIVDLRSYWTLKLLYRGVTHPGRINYLNIDRIP